MLHLNAIITALKIRSAQSTQAFVPTPQHAAVALALAGEAHQLHLCFIRRVERVDDPWSGHMALPGGRAARHDAEPPAVAARESTEEVGLNLAPNMLLATLPKMEVNIGNQQVDMTLWPVVYYAGAQLPTLTIAAKEVAQAYWIPLAHLWDEQNHTSIERTRAGEDFVYASIAFEGQTIWGLTHRVLHLFAQHINLPLAGVGGGKTLLSKTSQPQPANPNTSP